jgi:hypothetical protein
MYRPFEEARKYARDLGLKNQLEWQQWSKSGQRPDDIPSAPNEVYEGQWRGWGDWLGAVNMWTSRTLLSFLKDLRPRLPQLEERELYLIIQQGGMMPGLRRALGKASALAVLKDLKDNDGRAIEEALASSGKPDEEVSPDEDLAASDMAVDALEERTTETLGGEPWVDDGQGDAPALLEQSGGLPTLATGEALRAVDELANLHYGLDDETVQYLIDNRVAALWDGYTNDGAEAVEDALRGEGGYYFDLIRGRFYEELAGAQTLPVPAGWAFRPPGREDEAPTPPNLMQRRTAYTVMKRKRVGNWSGVGSGKTLSGILASRILGRRHTLVICNNATVKGWCAEIGRAFPDSVVHTIPAEPNFAGGAFHYTVLNYEKFQQANRNALVLQLASSSVDFVILDEVQFVKQRDKNASFRRQVVAALLSMLHEQNRDIHVLGMSATPVINSLLEARKLLEIVKGRPFADLDTQPTVNNALAVHRALMVNGLRYRPRYETEVELPPCGRSGTTC